MTRLVLTVSCVLLVWIAAPAHANAADLQAQTAAAFDRYVKLTEARIDEEMRGKLPFLWIETLSETERRDVDARLRRGEVVVTRLETRDGGRSIKVPDGLCHHWVATVFLPGAGIDRTVALMQSYDKYQDIYRPAVRQSRMLSRDGDHFKVYLQLFMKKVISVVLNSEYDVRYVTVAPKQMQVRSSTTRIAEVRDPGMPQEQERPVGHDSGFLWRFNNYCALAERGEGTYVQCESVSLSRSIPTGLGWLVGPFVTSIPKESLEFTLGTMRTQLAKGRS
jgi:hypothetical protein